MTTPTTRRCAGIVGAIIGLAVSAGCAVGGLDLPPNPPPDPSIPGVQPTVQQWLAAREPVLLALDDAIVAVNRQLEKPPPAAATGCAKLGDSAAALLAMPAPPVSELAAPAAAGLADFTRAAESCRAGDYAGAAQLMAAASTLRADASLVQDMLLLGRNAGPQG